MLTFYLNGKLTVESDQEANISLLRYLRLQQNLTGVKEGCASGDCGACTVLIGEQDQGCEPASQAWHYYSANACILFLSQLNGKSVITVDALAQGSHLHPAQQALIELHGSQCGFCTPGFVMSMAALYENAKQTGQAQKSRAEIEAALSGNLCRCTGYRPIIDATVAMFDTQRFSDNHQPKLWQPESQSGIDGDVVGNIDGNKDDIDGLCTPNSQTWLPNNEEQLQHLLNEHPDAQVLAGATDLALQVTQHYQTLDKIISLHQIASLQEIRVEADEIHIGAMARYSDIEALMQQHYPEFGALLNRLGSRQIRNNGTLGGNIANASPIGDTPPVLIALGAEITLASLAGECRMPLAHFFVDYKVTQLQDGEYIRTIHIPRLQPDQQLKVYKISKRLEDDISAVLFAATFTLEQQRIKAVSTGFGGMAAIAKSAPSLEQALLGKMLTPDVFEQAAKTITQDFSPLTDVRASAEYRLQVAQGLVNKCGLELMYPESISRIEQIHAVDHLAVIQVEA